MFKNQMKDKDKKEMSGDDRIEHYFSTKCYDWIGFYKER